MPLDTKFNIFIMQVYFEFLAFKQNHKVKSNEFTDHSSFRLCYCVIV